MERNDALSKIMIVDDDQTTVSLLATLLELDGFDVVTVRTGRDAVRRAEEERPELIMVDFHLTDMEGVDIIKAIRSHSTLSGTPIVMASGLDVSDAALAAGADKFLIKPFEPSDLPELFNTLIVG
jgi:DNA-binding response OmpR family regulator